MADVKTLTLAFLGATGRMGYALAMAHAKAGYKVIIGSRDASRAAEAAAKLTQQLQDAPGAGAVDGAELSAAAAAADVVFLVYGDFVNENKDEEIARRAATLRQLGPHLSNKTVVDVTNIGYLLEESAWGQTSSLLLNMRELQDPTIKWACAWKCVAWKVIEDGGSPSNPYSVFVNADDVHAKATLSALINSLPGFRAVDAGGVAESKLVEMIGPRWFMTLIRSNFAAAVEAGQWPGWRFGL